MINQPSKQATNQYYVLYRYKFYALQASKTQD
jgi:hypothetical protein